LNSVILVILSLYVLLAAGKRFHCFYGIV